MNGGNKNYNGLSYLIYQILKTESSVEKPMGKMQLLRRIRECSGEKPSRNTLTSILNDMVKYNCPIQGVGVDRSKFWLDESYTLLTASVERSFMREETAFLNKKLDRALGVGGTKYIVKRVYDTKGDIHQNADIIKQAMKSDRKLQFVYGDTNLMNEFIPRKDKSHRRAMRMVSVYDVIFCNGFFYMVASENDTVLRNYRIDKMRSLKIAGKGTLPLEKVYPGKTYSTQSYISSQNYRMFGGEKIGVRFRFRVKKQNERMYYENIVLDEFGKNAQNVVYLDKKSFEFTVALPRMGALIFARQYADKCAIVSPPELVDEMKHDIRKASRWYGTLADKGGKNG